MRNLWLFGLAGLLGLTLCVATPGYSDDQKKSDEKTQTVQKPVAAEKATTEAKPRLPRGWGRLNLTGEQRDKAVDVMKKYRTQIEELRAQLAELEKKQHEELSSVLTDEQKARLAAEMTHPRIRSFPRRSNSGSGAQTEEKKD